MDDFDFNYSLSFGIMFGLSPKIVLIKVTLSFEIIALEVIWSRLLLVFSKFINQKICSPLNPNRLFFEK